ncbi:MAG: hypothetical protein PUE73_01645 [Eubacteriales bacterium]|nr:hypothetical protein [Eubacteriales bacterium]
MASTCPNCGKKLHIYEIKAECSQCGVSIPNFNWEARLEEDNIKAEQKFSSFYKILNRIAYSIYGTKLRIARIILSFIPIVGYILPWATLKSDTKSIGIDLFGMTSDVSLLDLLKSFFGNTELYFTNMAYEGYAGTLTYTMISVLLMVLCLLFMVIAFFLIIFKAKKPKTKAMVVFDILGVLSAVASAVVFTLGVNAAQNQVGFNFGDIPIYNATGGIAWGYYVAIALLVVATVVNILVAKAPAKDDEVLEAERLARKAAKEEKERQQEIEREKARIENEKRQAEEQAEIVAKAKAKLAEMENKK